MKSIYRFIFTLLFLVAISGCTKDQKVLFQFEMETDFSIPPGLNTFETFYFPISRVPTNIENFIGSNNIDEIGAILPSRASITASFSEYDWSNVQEVVVYVASTTDPQNREEVFYQNRINFNEQNELRLFSSSIDVKDIMKDPVVNVEVAFRFRNITPAEIRSRIKLKFLANELQ